jgi:hypothetical protein
MGYTDTESQYLVYVLDKEKVKIFDVCNVKFDESIMGGSLLRNSDHKHYDPNSVGDLSQPTLDARSILGGTATRYGCTRTIDLALP